MPTNKSTNLRRKETRINLAFKHKFRCVYCNGFVMLRSVRKWGESEPDNLATIEHVHNRLLDGHKRKPGRAHEKALACKSCNNYKGRHDKLVYQHEVGVKAIRRSGGNWLIK